MLSSFAAPATAGSGEGLQAIVTKVDRPEQCLRIRTGPSIQTEKIGCASMGDKLVLSGVTQRGWAQAEFPVRGWVSGSQVASQGLFSVRAATSGKRTQDKDKEEYLDEITWDFTAESGVVAQYSPSSMYWNPSSGFYASSGPRLGLNLPSPSLPAAPRLGGIFR
jgi:hypothetical protein